MSAGGSGIHLDPNAGALMHLTSAEEALILPRPHPAVMFREVSDGAVLLQMEEEIYFGLNPVGARVWQLLPPTCTSIEDLCDRLHGYYPDVPAEQILADVTELLGELRKNKLLVDAS
jgi:hypothetical protein